MSQQIEWNPWERSCGSRVQGLGEGQHQITETRDFFGINQNNWRISLHWLLRDINRRIEPTEKSKPTSIPSEFIIFRLWHFHPFPILVLDSFQLPFRICVFILLKIIWDVTERFLSHPHVAHLVATRVSAAPSPERPLRICMYVCTNVYVPCAAARCARPINNIKHVCRRRRRGRSYQLIKMTQTAVSAKLSSFQATYTTMTRLFFRGRGREGEKNELWLLPCKRAGEMSKWQRLIYDFVLELSKSDTLIHILVALVLAAAQSPSSSVCRVSLSL